MAASATGFGGGGGNDDLPFTQRQGGKGYLGVVGGGFDYQFTPRLVGGVFADFNFASLKGTIQDQGPFFGGNIKEDRAWAVGVRGGYLITPALLSYVNGGYTNAHFSSARMVNTITLAQTAFSTPAFSHDGVFVGGGTETTFAPNWYWRTEYRLAYYGNQVLPDTNGTGLFVNNLNFKPTVQTVTTPTGLQIQSGHFGRCHRGAGVERPSELDRFLCQRRHRLRALGG